MFKRIAMTLVVAMSMFVGVTALVPTHTYAEVAAGCKNDFLGFPAWYEYLEVGPKNGDACAITGPTDGADFSFQKALPRIGLGITDILLRVAGMVTVGYIIFGGFKYMTSQGEPDGLKQAQGTVVNALIGLAIAVMAVTIVNFVGTALWK